MLQKPGILVENAINSESDYLAQARSGNTQAFSGLVELYQERAVHIAYSFMGNMEDARDVAQEAFVKAYYQLGSFQEQSRFYTWLYRIIVNTCKDFLRKKKLRNHLSFWPGNDDGEMVIAWDAPDKSKTAGEEMVNREIGVELKKAMEQLPFQQKSVFTLRYLEGMKLEEIAQTLDLSVGAVKAHLWQATTKMKSQLKYLWEGE